MREGERERGRKKEIERYEREKCVRERKGKKEIERDEKEMRDRGRGQGRKRYGEMRKR